MAYLLNRWSLAQDRTEPDDVQRQHVLNQRQHVLAGPGMVVLFLTISFAAVDWVMSLEPHWYSTIYPVLMMMGMGLGTFAFMTIVTYLLRPYSERLRDFAGASRFHDLGNLMLAFVMLWAYMSYSQFFIIWSGNLTEEIPWYLHRGRGGWQWVAALLAVGHFALPFFLLLFRDSKRQCPGALADRRADHRSCT